MGEFSKIDLSGDKLDGLTKRLNLHCAATDCSNCLIGTLAMELLAARARIAACEAECARLITDNKQDMASDRELVQLRARVAELEVPWWRRLWKRKAKRPSMAAVTRALEPQRRPGESDEELRKRIQG